MKPTELALVLAALGGFGDLLLYGSAMAERLVAVALWHR